MIKVKVFIIFSIILMSVSIGFSQGSVKKPLALLPGNSIINNSTDTMWVLSSTSDFKKVINAKYEAETYFKINEINKKIIDSLELISITQKELIERCNIEYDSCFNVAEKCDERLNLMGELNTKQTMYTKIAILSGVTTTIAAFVVGFILGMK